jgi:ABC-2 type transport system permease protein
MNALVGAELLKLRTLRSPRWIAAGTVVLAGGIGAVGTRLAAADGETVAITELARAPMQPAWFAVIVLAVLASAGEFQHRAIRTTLFAAPRRLRVLLAKTVSAGLVGMAVVAVAVVSAVASGLVTAAGSAAEVTAGSGADLGLVAAGICLGGVWAIFATALGLLTRSTALALVVVLLWRFVGEGVVPVLLRDPGAYAWTPSGAAGALVSRSGPEFLLPDVGAALLLALYVLALCGAAGALFVRRDPA